MKKLLFITLLALPALQFSGEIFAMKQGQNEESKKRKTDDPSREGQAPVEKQKKTEVVQDPEAAANIASAAITTTTGNAAGLTTEAIPYFDQNGFDDSLVMLIFSFCDVESLGKAAQTCKRFNAISKNPELLQGILQTLLSCNAENPTSVIRYADVTKILTQYPHLQNAALFQNQAEALIVGINSHIRSLSEATKIIKYLEEVLKTGFDNPDIFNKISPALDFNAGKSYILDLFLKYCCREIIATLCNQMLIDLTPEEELTEPIIRATAKGSNFARKIGKPERFKSLLEIIAKLLSDYARPYARRPYLRPDMLINPILIAAKEGAPFFAILLMQKNFDILSTDKDGSNVLHLAIENSQYNFAKWILSLDSKIVTKLLDQGKANGETPVQTAIRKNNISIVTELIKRAAKNIAYRADRNGNTLLHHAVESGSLSMVQFILNHGEANNIHIPNGIGISPMALADGLGYTEIHNLLNTTKPSQEPKDSSKCSIQ
ncbi:MAG: ankyrin repeat domain-containing protein [bacterium]